MEPALAKLTARDHGLLLALREHASLGFAPRDVLERIERKLAVSGMLSTEDDAASHVQIGSILTGRPENSAQAVWKIVLSARLAVNAQNMPVTSPLGILLLGLRQGSAAIMPETKQNIAVLSVEPPPTARQVAVGLPS